MPVVDLLMPAEAPEPIKGLFQVVRLVDEMRIVMGKKFGSLCKWKMNLNDAGCSEAVPQSARAVDSSDTVGLSFCEDRFGGVVAGKFFPKASFEEFL